MANKDETDILWGMYQEHCTQGRHHETQRATVTNLIVAVSAGIISLVTYDKQINLTDLPLTAFLTAIGLFGAALSHKHYERFCFHMDRAREYRNELDKLVPQAKITALKQAADDIHKKHFSRGDLAIRLNWLWLCLHFLIAILGVLLSILAFLNIDVIHTS